MRCTTAVLAMLTMGYVNMSVGYSDHAPFLGASYSSDKQQVGNVTCVDNRRFIRNGVAYSDLTLGAAQNFSQLQKALRIDIRASGGFDMFSIKGRVRYLRHLLETHYSYTFNFLQLIKFPSKQLTLDFFEAALSDNGRRAYALGPERFRALCGDKFISSIQQGALLSASLTVRFFTSNDKKNFLSHLRTTAQGIWKTKADILRIFEQQHLKGSIELSAYQEGGAPSELSHVFDQSQQGYYFTQCTLDDKAACDGIIRSILYYAEHDFIEQIKRERDNNTTGIDYTTASYDSLGLSIAPSQMTPEIQHIRLSVADRYLANQDMLEFVQHVLQHPFIHLSHADATDLQHAEKDLLRNAAILESPTHGAIVCFDRPTDCRQWWQDTQVELKAVVSPTIETYRSGYLYSYRHPDGLLHFALAPIGHNRFLQVNSTYKYEQAFVEYFNISFDLGEGLENMVRVNHANGEVSLLRRVAPGYYIGGTVFTAYPAQLMMINNPL